MKLESLRGITPEILFQHIENTASFLLLENAPQTEFLTRLRSYHRRIHDKLSHEEYFELCLCAHYSTVATFVPTDVDNQIRQRLWNQNISPETSRWMAELTTSSRKWNFRPVTTRFAQEPTKRYISGHQGEWFSVAVGAYAKHRTSDPELAERVFQEIILELREESEIYAILKGQKNGIELLKACTLIAHNLGDLDRVITQWDLAEDRLLKSVFKFGHEARASALVPLAPLFSEAGALNKAFMASENHRHYPLRAPKSLRKSLDFLLPIGPFFDSWGKTLATHPLLTPEDLAEIIVALLEGFEKLSSPKIPLYGYARALSGIARNLPGGWKKFPGYLSAKNSKKLQEGPLHRLMQEEESRFTEAWNKKAIQFLI